LLECRENVRATVNLLTKLGFVLHPEKCNLVPSTEIKFLGFYLNSEETSFRLPDEKVDKIVGLCQ
jgi:hypothetical protein